MRMLWAAMGVAPQGGRFTASIAQAPVFPPDEFVSTPRRRGGNDLFCPKRYAAKKEGNFVSATPRTPPRGRQKRLSKGIAVINLIKVTASRHPTHASPG